MYILKIFNNSLCGNGDLNIQVVLTGSSQDRIKVPFSLTKL